MESQQVDELAAELVELPLSELLAEIDARINAVIGDVDPATARAALDRAAEIMATRAIASARQARMLEMIGRLAHATAMPDGASPVRWLSEFGLVEWDPATGFRLTERAHPHVVP